MTGPRRPKNRESLGIRHGDPPLDLTLSEGERKGILDVADYMGDHPPAVLVELCEQSAIESKGIAGITHMDRLTIEEELVAVILHRHREIVELITASPIHLATVDENYTAIIALHDMGGRPIIAYRYLALDQGASFQGNDWPIWTEEPRYSSGLVVSRFFGKKSELELVVSKTVYAGQVIVAVPNQLSSPVLALAYD